MGVEIGGIIEEMHEDEEGRRIIDKVEIEYLSLIPDNGMMDALEFLGDDYIVRMPPVREYPVRARIKSVEKGTPRFVGLPDECYGCRYGSCDTCPPNLVVEDEVVDAMRIPGEISDEALETLLIEHGKEGLLAELRLKAHVDDEVLEEFEGVVDESAPPITFLDKIRYWTLSDWVDWLKGD